MCLRMFSRSLIEAVLTFESHGGVLRRIGTAHGVRTGRTHMGVGQAHDAGSTHQSKRLHGFPVVSASRGEVSIRSCPLSDEHAQVPPCPNKSHNH